MTLMADTDHHTFPAIADLTQMNHEFGISIMVSTLKMPGKVERILC
jgi:hypothetical protein